MILPFVIGGIVGYVRYMHLNDWTRNNAGESVAQWQQRNAINAAMWGGSAAFAAYFARRIL